MGCLIGPYGIVYAPRTQNNVVTDSLVAFTDTGSSLERMWQIGLPYIPFATFGVDLQGDIYSYNYDYQVIHIDSHSGEVMNQSPRIYSDIPDYRTSFAGGTICAPSGENTVRIHYYDPNLREPTILDTSIIIGDPNLGIVAPHAAVDAEGYLYISNYQNTVFCFEPDLDLIWQDTFDRPDGPAIGMDGHLVICADSYEMRVYEGRGIISPGFVFGNVTLIGGTGNIEDVEISTGSYITNPEATGLYTFELPPDTYNISAYLNGYFSQIIENIEVLSGQPTGPIDFDLIATVEVDPDQISKITSLSNYPNPFNPSTTISFSLTAKDAQEAKIEIYNLKGQKIKTFSNLLITQSSNQEIVWNGEDDFGKQVSSGIYFYKLKSGDFQQFNKMVLMK